MQLDNRRFAGLRLVEVVGLSVLPILLFLFVGFLSALKGPYYLGPNLDPEYAYLLNSLRLLSFASPAHTDHPGTPVQMLGAVIIIVKYSLASLDPSVMPLQYEVLSNPENYLKTIHLVLNGLISGLSFLVGVKIYTLKRSWPLALLFQLSPFVFRTLLISAVQVSPEPVLMFCVLGLSLLLVPVFSGRVPHLTLRKSIFLGGLLGFGMATKVTLFPLLLLLLLSDRFKVVIAGFVSCVVSFFFFTLPMSPRYKLLGKWIMDLATHEGRYGGGPVGIPSVDVLWNNLKTLYNQEPYFFVFTGVVLLLLLFLFLNGTASDLERPGGYLKGVTILASVLIVQIAITVKDPAIHYMVPSLSLIGLVIYAFSQLLKCYGGSKFQRIFAQSILGGCFVALAVSSVKGSVVWGRSMEKFHSDVLKLQKTVGLSFGECVVIYYYRSSSPQYALAFGNEFSKSRFGVVLAELYPNFVSYNIWNGKLYGYVGEVSVSDLTRRLDNGQCVLMQGTPFDGHYAKFRPAFELQRLDDRSGEAIYKVRSFKYTNS